MIPVFYEKPEDLRQPHCWIDPNKVLRLTPIYGVRDSHDDFYWIALPSSPNAEVFAYRILYCDNRTYESSKQLVEETFHLKPSEKIGFAMPQSREPPKGEE